MHPFVKGFLKPLAALPESGNVKFLYYLVILDSYFVEMMNSGRRGAVFRGGGLAQGGRI
ncbi:MAG: hypothetical protein ACLGQH_00265 [Acidobacteriota bacterium]